MTESTTHKLTPAPVECVDNFHEDVPADTAGQALPSCLFYLSTFIQGINSVLYALGCVVTYTFLRATQY